MTFPGHHGAPQHSFQFPLDELPPPRRRTERIVGIAVVVALVLGGATTAVLLTRRSGHPTTGATALPPGLQLMDPNGAQACTRIKALVANMDTDTDTDTVTGKPVADDDLQPIVDAGSKSSDTGVASQSRMLGAALDVAKAAGPADFRLANLNVGTATIQLYAACEGADLLP